MVVIPKDGSPLSDSFIPEIPSDPRKIAKTIQKAKTEIDDFLHPQGSITATDPMTGIYGYFVPEIQCLVVLDKIEIPIFGLIYQRPDDSEYIQGVIDNIVNNTVNANAIKGSEASNKTMKEGIHIIVSSGKEKAEDIELEIKWDFKITLDEKNKIKDIEVPPTVWAESFRLFLYAKKYEIKKYDEAQWTTLYKKYIEEHKTECHSGIYTGNYESFTSDLEEYIELAKNKKIAEAEKAQEDEREKEQAEKLKEQASMAEKSKVYVSVEDNLSNIRSNIRSGVSRILGQGTKPSSIRITLGYNFTFTKKEDGFFYLTEIDNLDIEKITTILNKVQNEDCIFFRGNFYKKIDSYIQNEVTGFYYNKDTIYKDARYAQPQVLQWLNDGCLLDYNNPHVSGIYWDCIVYVVLTENEMPMLFSQDYEHYYKYIGVYEYITTTGTKNTVPKFKSYFTKKD